MLKETLQEDLKAAMRARDDVRLRTVRALRAAIMEKEISERKDGVAELTAEQELGVVQKQAKQRRDSIEQFESAGRKDLADREREELVLIETYLPKQLGDDEIRSVVQELVEQSGATSMRDIGKVMGPAMQQLKGRADGRRVQEAVKAILSENAA